MKQRVKYRLPIVMFFVRDLDKLENDAATQYSFNRFWAVIWFCAIVAVPFIPRLYTHDIGVLIIIEISLWANFATHFGAMSSALAARNTSKTVKNISEDVDDIHDAVAEDKPEPFNELTANLEV